MIGDPCPHSILRTRECFGQSLVTVYGNQNLFTVAGLLRVLSVGSRKVFTDSDINSIAVLLQ